MKEDKEELIVEYQNTINILIKIINDMKNKHESILDLVRKNTKLECIKIYCKPINEIKNEIIKSNNITQIIEIYKNKIEEFNNIINKLNRLYVKHLTELDMDDPTTNPKIEELSNKYKELTENRIYELVDSIQKEHKDLKDDELYPFLLNFLVVKGFENLKLNSGENVTISYPNNLSELSKILRENLNQEFDKVFMKSISNIEFDLKDFVILIYDIENSGPSIMFINYENPKKVKFNTKEHQLSSGAIKLRKVVCPGLVSNDYVIVKAKVEINMERLEDKK